MRQAGAELGQAQPQLCKVDQKFWFVEMFERFGLSIVCYVNANSIHKDSGSLNFGSLNDDIILVEVMVGLMKLKLNTAQQSTLS